MKKQWHWGSWICIVLICFAGVADAALPAPEGREVGLEKAELTLVGEDLVDWAGYFASPAGDVNGDGLGDVLIGAPMAGNKRCSSPDADPCPDDIVKGEGVGYLVLGRTRDEWPETPMSLAEADASFLGCEWASMTARQLYAAGDVNGDGYDDFLISGWKCTPEGTEYMGRAFLYLGRPTIDWDWWHPVEDADASFLGEHENDFLSYYTATAGDVNGDGYDDFLITSTHNDEAYEDAGQIYLILGRAEADWGLDYPVSQADASFLGEAEWDRLGRAVAGVGDVNGDGYEDFVLASIASDGDVLKEDEWDNVGFDVGESYLFLGRPSDSDEWWGMDFPVTGADASFVGEGEGDEAGRRVADAGDVNGDGLNDFLIGAARNDHGGTDAGIGYLILGRAEADWGMHYPLANADASFVGERAQDQAGRRLSGVGDVNNDGYSDFVIGAPHNRRGGTADKAFSGSAYLIYGRESADWGLKYPLSQADVIYVGKQDVGSAGYDMGWIGDFDGDGIDDFLIAAYGGRNNDFEEGETYILLGGEPPQPTYFETAASSGVPGKWHWFAVRAWAPNAAAKMSEVRLVLGRTLDDPLGLDIVYSPVSHTLSLRSQDGSTWIGPCIPGEASALPEVSRLTNELVAVDCAATRISYAGTSTVQVLVRARWPLSLQPSLPLAFNAYLRIVDGSGYDSGFQNLGTWSLSMTDHRVMLPMITRSH